jgi:hypothetical protein
LVRILSADTAIGGDLTACERKRIPSVPKTPSDEVICTPPKGAWTPADRKVADFVVARTHDGWPLRLLTIIDQYTRERMAIDVAREISSDDVPERLAWLFITWSGPGYMPGAQTTPSMGSRVGHADSAGDEAGRGTLYPLTRTA